MSASMKAVIARAAGGPDVLELVERPRPVPENGEILLRVRAAGVNRPDVMQREGAYPPPPGASDILGLEIAGVVEACGPGVSRFQVGDAAMGLVASGAYAEWVAVHESNALGVPQGMSFIEAAAFPETYFTVWSNLFERAKLVSGETVLIHGGASGIGTTAIQLATARGARAIVTAGSPEKCAACLELGAQIAIDYRREDFVEAARRVTDGKGPHVIVDMVGGDYIQRNLEAVAVDGRIAQIAFQRGARTDLDLGPLLMKRITLTGSTLRARPVAMKAELARALEKEVLPLLARGQARPVIDTTYPLAAVADAHRRMDSGKHVGKIVLDVNEGAAVPGGKASA